MANDPTGPVSDVLEMEAPVQPAQAFAGEVAAPVADEPTSGGGAALAPEPEVEAGLAPTTPLAPQPIIPHIPFPVGLRNVTGRYLGQAGAFQLELRVDLDGAHPLNKVSGDFYLTSGGTTT